MRPPQEEQNKKVQNGFLAPTQFSSTSRHTGNILLGSLTLGEATRLVLTNEMWAELSGDTSVPKHLIVRPSL